MLFEANISQHDGTFGRAELKNNNEESKDSPKSSTSHSDRLSLLRLLLPSMHRVNFFYGVF